MVTSPRGPGPLVALGVVAALLVACGGGQPDPGPEDTRAAGQEQAAAAEEPEPEPEPEGIAPLTGEEILDAERAERLAQRPAVTVKIPNSPEARPHTGLEDADVVYEEETEGGTTRFAAVFHSTYPEVVGNVRSARFVDVPLVAPYDGVMAYSGARAAVQERIAAAELATVTEGGPGFYRDGSRSAPHNLYLRLREAAASREASPAAPAPWTFDEEPPAGGQPVTGRVEVAVSRSATTGWEYDDGAGAFRRLQNGTPHRVTGSDRIAADNVVLLDVVVSSRDSHGAPVYELDGSGDALLLRDGEAFDVDWRKEGVAGSLELVDDEDEAVLAPGATWVVLTYDGALDRATGIG